MSGAVSISPTARGRIRSRGFTLIETMVLLGLITIGLAAILYLIAVGTNLNADTRDTVAAYAAANEYMDYLRQQPFTSIVNVTGSAFGTAAGQVGYNNLSNLANAQGTYTIANYGGNSDIKQATVQVSWTHAKAARDRTITIMTLIAQNGLNERWQ